MKTIKGFIHLDISLVYFYLLINSFCFILSSVLCTTKAFEADRLQGGMAGVENKV